MKPFTFSIIAVLMLGMVTANAQDAAGIPQPLTQAIPAQPPASENYQINFVPQTPASVFFVQTDAMFLHLGGSAGHNIPYADFDQDDAKTPLSQIADGRYRVVPRLAIGEVFSDGTGWEAIYFGRNDWQKSSTMTGLDETQAVSMSSSLHSGEVNSLNPIGFLPGAQFLLGIRSVHFGERLLLAESEFGNNVSSGVTNNLFGGQIGTRYSHDWRRLNLTATGKVGVYDNFVIGHQYGAISNGAGFDTIDNSSHTNRVSFIWDLSLISAYRINDAWTFRAGYQLLWLDGVARAATQVNDTGFVGNVSPVNSAFLHGPTAGFELRF